MPANNLDYSDIPPGNIAPADKYGGRDRHMFWVDPTSIIYDPTKSYGSAQVGLPVKRISHATVALAGKGDKILGNIIKVESDNAAVIVLAEGVKLKD